MPLFEVRAFLAALGCALALAAAAIEAETHPRGLHSAKDIAFVADQVAASKQPWKSAYQALIGHAEQALKHAPQALEDFNVPGYYGSGQEKHNRMKALIAKDASAAYVTAVAWHLATGSDKGKRDAFGKKSLEILNDWARKNKKHSGADGNLVMSYNGHMLAKAGSLMLANDGWSAGDRSAFAGWVRSVLLKAGDEIDGRDNNWGDWGCLTVAVSASFLDDGQRLSALHAQLEGRIKKSIKADGEMGKETSRGGNGLWYTYFALAPLAEACMIVGNATGKNLFSISTESGKSLKRALDYLLRYSKNPGSWPHTKITNDPRVCSTCWPGNLFEGMADIYGSSEYESYAKPGRSYFRNSTGLTWSLSTLFKGTYNVSDKPTPVLEPVSMAPVGALPAEGRAVFADGRKAPLSRQLGRPSFAPRWMAPPELSARGGTEPQSR